MSGFRRRLEVRLDAMSTRLDRIDAALVVRDPGNARSAEAYEGLRKTVIAAGRDRRRHLAHLVMFAEAVERATSNESLAELVEQWAREEGLERSWDTSRSDLFTRTDGAGDTLQVVRPAWVDAAPDRPSVLVKHGIARPVAAEDLPSPDGPMEGLR